MRNIHCMLLTNTMRSEFSLLDKTKHLVEKNDLNYSNATQHVPGQNIVGFPNSNPGFQD